MSSQVVSVTEFKAKCLSLLDKVAKKGGTIIVTKRGKPVATVSPVKKRKFPSTEGMLRGKIAISDELLNAGLSDPWEDAPGRDVSTKEKSGL
jgi:prevent-host-death family protein